MHHHPQHAIFILRLGSIFSIFALWARKEKISLWANELLKQKAAVAGDFA